MNATDSPSVLADWRTDNAIWLRLALRRLRMQLHELALMLDAAHPAAGWLVAGDDSELASGAPADLLAQRANLEIEMSGHEERMRSTGSAPAYCQLVERFGLDRFEAELLLLAAAPSIDGAFARVYAELQGGISCATLHLGLALFVAKPERRLILADALMPGRRLRTFAVLLMDEPGHEPATRAPLAVDGRLVDLLRGVNRPDEHTGPLLLPLSAGPCSIAATEVGERAARIIESEAETWVTVNLLGHSSGGVAEAIQHTCGVLGLQPRRLDLSYLAALALSERHRLIARLGREALLGQWALVADAGTDPSAEVVMAIDELIAALPATLFVVSATPWHREGLATLAVARAGRHERRSLWRTALGGRADALAADIEALAEEFDLAPSAIAAVVARAGATADGAGLRALCREQIGSALADLARRIEPCFGWDDIVVGDEVRSQLRALASQVASRGQVYETWGFGAKLSRGRGIAALFAGPSGTGKTMAAEILAAHLNLELYRVDLAGVVSKYVGETEKNLRRVFDAAEGSGAILFFDEADALFGSRTEVRDSHDRYANLEINYLLQRMEEYSGLAILATNRRSALDPAFLRRLRFVIDFPFPGQDERRRIWQRAIPKEAPLSDVEWSFLARLDLSGGNIRSVVLNAAFLAAARGSPIDMACLVHAAAREYAKLGKPVGAADFGEFYALARS